MMQSSQSAAGSLAFDFYRCIEWIAKSKEAGSTIAGQDVMLLLGQTGAGKSTLIHYLCGSTMEIQMVDGLSHIGPVDVRDASLMAIKTSPHKRSETRYISAVGLQYSDLGLEREGGVFLCDTPGFEDTGGAEIDIANSLGVVESLKSARSVRVVVLFARDVGRGGAFRDTAHLLVKLVKKIECHIDTFSFVFTKYTPEQLKEVHAELKSIKTHASEQEKADRDLMRLFEAMLEETEEGALGFDPLSGGSGAKKFLKKLLTKESIVNPGEVFHFSVSEKSRNALKQQLDYERKMLEDAVSNDNTVTIKDMIEQLVQIQKGMPLEEINILYEHSSRFIQQRVELLCQQAHELVDRFLDVLMSKGSMENYIELHRKLLAYQEIHSPCFKLQDLPSDQLLSKISALFSSTEISKLDYVLESLRQLSLAIDSFQEVYALQKTRVDAEAERLRLSRNPQPIVTEDSTINQSVSRFLDKIEAVVQQGCSKPHAIKDHLVDQCLEHLASLGQAPQYHERVTTLVSQLKSILDKKTHVLIDSFQWGLEAASPELSVEWGHVSWVQALKDLFLLERRGFLIPLFPGFLIKIINKIEQYWLPLKHDSQKILSDDKLKEISWITNCFESLSFIEAPVFLDYKESYFDWLEAHWVFCKSVFDKTFATGKLEFAKYQGLDRCYKAYSVLVKKEAGKDASAWLLAHTSLSIDKLDVRLQELLSREVSIVSELSEQETEKKFLLLKHSEIQMLEGEYTATLPINSKLYMPWYVSNFFLTSLRLKSSPWETASALLKERGYCSLGSLRARLDEVSEAMQELEEKHTQLQEELRCLQEERGRLAILRLQYSEHVDACVQSRARVLQGALEAYSLPSAEVVTAKLSRWECQDLFDMSFIENRVASIAEYKKLAYFRERIIPVNHGATIFLSQYSKMIQQYLSQFLLNCFDCNKETCVFVLPLLKECIKLADSACHRGGLLADFFPRAYWETLIEELAYNSLLFSDEFCKSESSGSLVACFDAVDRLRIMSACEVYLKKGIFSKLHLECCDSLYSYVANLEKQARNDFEAGRYSGVKLIIDQLRSVKEGELIHLQLEKLGLFLFSSVNNQCSRLRDDLILLRFPIASQDCGKIITEIRAIKELSAVFVSDDVFSLVDTLQDALKFAEERLNTLLGRSLDNVEQHIILENFRFAEDKLSGVTALISLAQGVLRLDSADRLPIVRQKTVDALKELESFYLSSDLRLFIRKPLLNFHENICTLIYDFEQPLYSKIWSAIERAVIEKFNEALHTASMIEDAEKCFFESVLRSFPLCMREPLLINLQEKERLSHHANRGVPRFF